MNAYGQYCPVARAAEIFADRWTPLIIRELLEGMHHFNELDRGLPGISRSLLVQRLRQLEHCGVVERRVDPRSHTKEYHLARAGLELKEVVDVLGEWGARWAFADPKPSELDPVLLMWWVRRRINMDLLPERRIVVQFDFRGPGGRTLWLLLDRSDVSVCLKNPGFDTDLLVATDLAIFYRVWLGRIPLAQAIREDLIQIEGTTPLVRAFPQWLRLSVFAPKVHAVTQQALA
jgi:DNA-binding HxlR family transcriptional regulator